MTVQINFIDSLPRALCHYDILKMTPNREELGIFGQIAYVISSMPQVIDTMLAQNAYSFVGNILSNVIHDQLQGVNCHILQTPNTINVYICTANFAVSANIFSAIFSFSLFHSCSFCFLYSLTLFERLAKHCFRLNYFLL